MHNHSTTKWREGLPFIQFAKNTAYYSGIHFLWWFQTPLSECIQRLSGFPGSPRHLLQSSGCGVHVSTMETTRNCMVRDPGCAVDVSSLQYCSTQTIHAQEQLYATSIVPMKNPQLKKFWSFPPDMIKESFQYHLVIFLTYPHFWRAGMLIGHPSAIKEGNLHHFAHWLLLTNLFCPRYATIESCLWLMFHFRIVMMNPGFISSDDTREKVWILGDSCQIFWKHWRMMLNFFSLQEITLKKHASFQTPSLKWAELTFSWYVGHLPSFEWMNDSTLQSPLTLCWCLHLRKVLSPPPTYVNVLHHLWMVESCNVSF